MSENNQSQPNMQSVTAHLHIKDAASAIQFYVEAFGATEVFRLTEPSGKVGHGEIRIGNSLLMLSDEYPDFGCLSPQTIGGSPMTIHQYVADADATVERAVAAGATLLRPVADHFYGDRGGTITDPFGFRWQIATRKREISPEEMQRHWSQVFEKEAVAAAKS